MLKRMEMAVWVMVASLLVLGGCQQKGDGPLVDETAVAEPVEILSQTCGDDVQLTLPMGVELVRNETELRALGSSELAEMDVNFRRHDLVVLSLGEQPTGGYWGRITGIQQVGDVLYVQGIANAPGAGMSVTQALTHPYCVARIAKTTASEARSDITAVQGQEKPQ
jgi:hypothetical protein